MVQVALGIGSNQGNREECLQNTIREISSRIGQHVSISPIIESEPWGYESDHYFLNQVVLVESELTPGEILEVIHDIEARYGRVRKDFYTDRPVDIDILFYGDQLVNTPLLKIPHPHIQKRLFVLRPLAEVAPGWVHPVSGKTVAQLLNACVDKTNCNWLK